MKIANWLRYPWDIRRAHQSIRARPAWIPAGPGRPVALDLHGDAMLVDCGRHLIAIAQNALALDSPVFLRCNRLNLAHIARKFHGHEFLSSPNVTWIPTDAHLPYDAVTLRDVAVPDRRRPATACSLPLLIGRTTLDEFPVMPYPMHPSIAATATPERLHQARRRPKSRTIFFVGNQKPRYGRSTMREGFGVLSRLETIQAIRDQINRATNVAAKFDICLRDSRTDPVAPRDWLTTLAMHRVFLCCPGVSQPMCHNVVEAMSVGAIPLIEYGDHLHPRLTDGVNAICFHGTAGLADAVARLDAMSDDQLADLSRGAVDYYEQHLCGRSFLNRLLATSRREANQPVCLPFHSHDLFDPQRHRAA